MKIILILANNDVGLYRFRKELIEVLIKKYNYKVFISLPFGEFVPELIKLGCEFIDTKINRRSTNPINDFKLILSYMRIISKVKPDIVLTYTIKPNIYGGLLCRLMNIPYLVNITGLGTALENNGILQKIILALYKVSLKKASCIFFQNTENADFFKRKGIIKGKHKLIPGSGVNLDDYKVMEYPDDSVVNFLFVSRIMKEKGIDYYLEAAEYIRRKYKNVRFHIVGFCEEAYEEKLKIYEDKDIICYHGMQKDVREFYKISHCIIHPTYYPEGMSNVLLESAACGRPIITTDKSGCREVVDDGINGFLVKEKDSQDLIEKIEKFLKLDYENKRQMGLAGRMKVEKEFDRRIVVENYIYEIANILE